MIRSSERSAVAGIRATSAAERRNVTAFVQYATSTPSMARSSPAKAGPSVHATFSTVVSSDVACSRSSSVTRFGSPAHTAGRKKPVAMPFTAATATMALGSSTNGMSDERRRPHEVRDDHQPLAREPVDERAEREPDQDDREEVGDQERRQPPPGARLVVDVHREGERREIGADRRAGRRPEQQGEASVPAKEGQTACRSEEHALTLPPSRDAEQWRKTPLDGATAACRYAAARRRRELRGAAHALRARLDERAVGKGTERERVARGLEIADPRPSARHRRKDGERRPGASDGPDAPWRSVSGQDHTRARRRRSGRARRRRVRARCSRSIATSASGRLEDARIRRRPSTLSSTSTTASGSSRSHRAADGGAEMQLELAVVEKPGVRVTPAELRQSTLAPPARRHVAHGQHVPLRISLVRHLPSGDDDVQPLAVRRQNVNSPSSSLPRSSVACHTSSSCRCSGGQKGNGWACPTSSERAKPRSSQSRRLTDTTPSPLNEEHAVGDRGEELARREKIDVLGGNDPPARCAAERVRKGGCARDAERSSGREPQDGIRRESRAERERRDHEARDRDGQEQQLLLRPPHDACLTSPALTFRSNLCHP